MEARFPIQLPAKAVSTSQEIQLGLEGLKLKNSSFALSQSLDIQNKIYAALESAHKNTPQYPYQLTEKMVQVPLVGDVRELTVKFKSLIQRDNNDPSNIMTAKIYIHKNYNRNCDYKYPTNILLHHILNEVEKVEEAGMYLASGLLNNPGIFVVPHFPYYGDRTSQTKQFLTADLNEFQKNMIQLTLDIYLLKNLVETLPEVDTERISLAGLSLGGVVGYFVGAFDQSYAGYSFLNGGGDMASILLNRVQNRKDSEVALALKDLTASDDEFRSALAAVDGYTWAHRFSGKKIQILSASRDDIVDYKNSVFPLMSQLKLNNMTEQQLNDDTHSPSGSAFKKYMTVFRPLAQFVMLGKTPYKEACERIRR